MELLKQGAVDYVMKDRAAFEALRESERFSAIFPRQSAAIATTRLDDNWLVDVNGAWQKITGYSRTGSWSIRRLN